MTDSKLNKERIDEDLERLEIHSPSMRFTKSVVERVKLETNLIQKEQKLLPWIPNLCVAGFVLTLIALIVLSLNDNSQTAIISKDQVAQMLTNGLSVFGGLLLLLGFDRILRNLVVKR